MNAEDWKTRVDALTLRYLEKARECAQQHVALGKLMDIVEDAKHEYGDHQARELIMRFEEVLKPYQECIQKFHMAEWALRESRRDGPPTTEVTG